jgi:hypothetical protein
MAFFGLRKLIAATAPRAGVIGSSNELELPREPAAPHGSRPPVETDAKFLCIVAILKNESLYLREWIDFHLAEGVAHFFLYDNGSTDDPERLLQPYQSSGVASLIKWDNFAANLSAQNLAYAHAIVNLAHEYDWAAFIDIDEFLFGDERRNLAESLLVFHDFSAIRVKQYTFGPSGHLTRPQAPVTQSYLYRAPDLTSTQSIKSVVRPRSVTKVRPHYLTVTGKEYSFAAEDDQSSMPRLRINHYFTKSIAEFEAKFARGWLLRRVDSAKLREKKLRRFKLDDFNEFDDRILQVSRARRHRSDGSNARDT